MKAIWRGQTIAESHNTLEVGGYFYFPRDSVRMDFLKLSPKTARDKECPHGVQFYDVAEKRHPARALRGLTKRRSLP